MLHKEKTELQNKNNFERLLFKGIKNWKLFILVGLFSFVAVYLVERYTIPVYSVSSTILLKESAMGDASSAAELLFGSQQFKNSMNLNNESLILSSYPLVYETARALNFNVLYFNSGNIKTSEVYNNLPVKVVLDSIHNTALFNKVYEIEIIDNSSFKLFEKGDLSSQINGTFEFDKLISVDGFELRVLRQMNLENRSNEVVQFRLVTLDNATKEYRGKLQINSKGRESSVINLTINSRLPKKEVEFLEKLVSIYINKGLDEKNRNASRTIDFIDTQLKLIQDSLFLTENRLEDFKKAKGIINLSEEGTFLYQKMENLVEQRSSVLNQKNYYEYLRNYLKEVENSENVVVPSDAGAGDPVLNKLILDLIETQNEKSLIESESSQSPYLSVISGRISRIKRDVGSILENLIENVNIKETSLNSRWQDLRSEINVLPTAEKQFIHINRMYEINEKLYILLMEKRAEAAILKASSTPDIIVVNPPMVTGGKIAPQTTKNLGIALIVTLIVPIMFLYFKEFFNTKILYKEDIDQVASFPFLGVVGHEKSSENFILDKNPRSAVAESFRTIRSNISFFTSEKNKKIILITSSISGEGKTFCSINLSSVFALSGKKTIIVGADLRRPKLYDDFGLNNDVGVSNYLIDAAGLDDIIQPTKIDNLDLISSGSIPPNPSELLMKDKMDQLIESLKESYDYIILDTPPIGLVTDAIILMKYSDLTVYLVRQNYTPKGSIMNTQEMFENGQLQNISILFNDVKVEKYGYGYGYGYNYGYNSAYYSSNRKKGRRFLRWFS